MAWKSNDVFSENTGLCHQEHGYFLSRCFLKTTLGFVCHQKWLWYAMWLLKLHCWNYQQAVVWCFAATLSIMKTKIRLQSPTFNENYIMLICAIRILIEYMIYIEIVQMARKIVQNFSNKHSPYLLNFSFCFACFVVYAHASFGPLC